MSAAAWWETLVAAAAAAVGGTAGSNTTVVSICVFTAVLCLCLVAGHLLEENKWVNESITTLIIGCLIGAIILLLTKGKQSHILRFDEQLFFIYVLPPIIFNAGHGFCLCRFEVKKKQFFHNFMTIMSFGVFGVFISVAIVSAGCYWLFPKVGFGELDASDYLALGAIFSSTDTVCTLQVINQDETPRLYSLVFGEGVVNDATAVVLFNAIKNLNISQLKGGVVLKVIADFLYLFATSTILGISIGLSTSYVLKALYLGRHSTDREVALMALMAYLSYMLAELLDLSGILTVFFCGIVMSHYAWHNVTANSRITTKHIFATLSFIAETFIFLYVGMDALDIDKWKTSKASFKTSISIFGIIILLLLLGRAAFVFPISILSNNMSGSSERMPITFKHQVVIWWAGLMRGAVSIALAYNQGKYNAPSIVVDMQHFFAKKPPRGAVTAEPSLRSSTARCPCSQAKRPVVRVAAERRRRQRSAARAGGGVAGAESGYGAVEEGLLGGVDDENGGGAEGEGHGGSCGDAGAGDFRPRHPGAGAERSKWLWRSYSSDFLLRQKLLLRRCWPGVLFDSSSMSPPWMLNSDPAT